MKQAIILCGGLATRLGGLVKEKPKVLLEVIGKRVIDHQIEKLSQAGVEEVVLAAGHLADVLYKELGNNHYTGVKIKYAIEPKRLGTGGAIKFAWEHFADFNRGVMVLNGDILSGVNLSEFMSFYPKYSEGSIMGVKVEDASPYGTLVYYDDYLLKEFKEKEGVKKPAFINGGFYIFTPNSKKYFPDKDVFSVEYDVFPNMKKLYIYESEHDWIDIGVPERLRWARKNWNF